jgi:hypothetical protein
MADDLKQKVDTSRVVCHGFGNFWALVPDHHGQDQVAPPNAPPNGNDAIVNKYENEGKSTQVLTWCLSSIGCPMLMSQRNIKYHIGIQLTSLNGR